MKEPMGSVLAALVAQPRALIDLVDASSRSRCPAPG
jgi:hypothetical protein